jgi:hydroxymethylbilane synthase
VQSNLVRSLCRKAFPNFSFELSIIKTTGDKLQTASLAKEGETLPKGLFTKELEVALLNGSADIAVHSLKDLPVDLPDGLILGAVGKREDVRDVLIYRAANSPNRGAGRGFEPGLQVRQLPQGALIGTSSTRRKAQLLAQRPDLRVTDHRGNVLTRIEKLLKNPELDATILAAAGLCRLGYEIAADGSLCGKDMPEGILAAQVGVDEMLPCVGQGALGIETRAMDERISKICQGLNHPATQHAVIAERAFLRGMGGGCQSPVAAFGEFSDGKVRLRAASFRQQPARFAEGTRPAKEANELGLSLANQLQ